MSKNLLREFAQRFLDDYQSDEGMLPMKHYAKLAYEALEADLGGIEVPKINAMFSYEGNGIQGSCSVPVKRVEVNDDGSFTAVLDYWPPVSRPMQKH